MMTAGGHGCIIVLMCKISLPLEYLVRKPEVDHSDDLPPMLVLVHGLRSNEYDLFSLIPYLDERFIVISVRAPIVLGIDQYAWYRVEFHADRIEREVDDVERASTQLADFVNRAVEEYGADPKRVYLMGFSQGAMMSLALLFTHPETLAGVVSMSGALPYEALDEVDETSKWNGFPVMVVHGVFDAVIPIAEARATRQYLKQLNTQLDYREYPMSHQISDDSLDDVCGWLIDQLNAASEMKPGAE